MQNLISTLIEEFRQTISTFPVGISREMAFPEVANKIMVTIGMRRVGKTFFL